MSDAPVLVTGSTGYVGGRLVPRLLEAGFRVRAVGRSTAKLAARSWASHPRVELAQADMLDAPAMALACRGCQAAYYLVHSMNPETSDFAKKDRQAARTMALAAEAAGVGRIIYLGGLVPDDPNISHHLASRAEVAGILKQGRTPVTWLRAAMILGSGSASFELLRYLSERLPVMIAPRWVRTPCQPIAVENVLGYLAGCLDHPETTGETYDIGGPDVLTYEELFQTYAKLCGLRKRLIIPVPVLTPRLSSYWIHLVTPVPASLARPLAEGLRNAVVCRDNRIREIIPQKLLPAREAIAQALDRLARARVETCWMDAGEMLPPAWLQCADAPYAGGTVLYTAHQARLAAGPQVIWDQLKRLGGQEGWFHQNWLWRVRGWMDRMLGGVGLGRGRRHPEEVRVGDALDFWRILQAQPPAHLMLLAEMKLPGEAVLEFHLTPAEDGTTRLALVMHFLPRGLWGILYWYSVQPFHNMIGGGMLRAIAKRAGVEILEGPEEFKVGGGGNL